MNESAVHVPGGFKFSAIACGIKTNGLDLGLVQATPGTTAAAVFTKNRVVAAPIQVGRAGLVSGRGRVRAVLVNSGNANCATGKPGLQACRHICRELARLLHVPQAQIFPSSTGIIGVALPTEKILAKLPELKTAGNEACVAAFAHSIMTTDTHPKLASARFQAGKSEVRLLGIAKGSGMIHPQLATMLVYIFTDVASSPRRLQQTLCRVCDETFNCISVDGDTSTNDTVLLMASGQSGVKLDDKRIQSRFEQCLLDVCQNLAEQIVCDGEGVRHVIQLRITQAKNRSEALRVARAIANSALVKTAWAGADPNWGRILAAIGASGVPIRPEKISISIGDQVVCRGGTRSDFNEAAAHRVLAQSHCRIQVSLGCGSASANFLTNDLTAEYVRINAEYAT